MFAIGSQTQGNMYNIGQIKGVVGKSYYRGTKLPHPLSPEESHRYLSLLEKKIKLNLLDITTTTMNVSENETINSNVHLSP